MHLVLRKTNRLFKDYLILLGTHCCNRYYHCIVVKRLTIQLAKYRNQELKDEEEVLNIIHIPWYTCMLLYLD